MKQSKTILNAKEWLQALCENEDHLQKLLRELFLNNTYFRLILDFFLTTLNESGICEPLSFTI